MRLRCCRSCIGRAQAEAAVGRRRPARAMPGRLAVFVAQAVEAAAQASVRAASAARARPARSG
ncbi:hypothetical protein [Brevundimonas sp. GCM10030266]|uniref:hypothetical protein n=1 Tax=Brevundimonas sp. GCM10030266 TaxID=3273386 RepID=UPI003622C83A